MPILRANGVTSPTNPGTGARPANFLARLSRTRPADSSLPTLLSS